MGGLARWSSLAVLLLAVGAAAADDVPTAPVLTPAADLSTPSPAPAPAAPPASTEAAPRFSGWHAAGIWGGGSLGGSFGALTYLLAAELSPRERVGNCPGSACAIAAFGGLGAGLIAGGVLGYFLGGLARDAWWARILTMAADVTGLPVTLFSFFFVATATGNLPTGGG